VNAELGDVGVEIHDCRFYGNGCFDRGYASYGVDPVPTCFDPRRPT
jgi:hypothetical protein